MSHQEFSSSRPEICPQRTMLRGHLPEAGILDHMKLPCCQHKGELPSMPASCGNICRVLSPQHARSEQCPIDTPAVILGDHGRLHDHSLELRHRRIPAEREVADPEEASAPGEEDTPEEEDAPGKEGPTDLRMTRTSIAEPASDSQISF